MPQWSAFDHLTEKGKGILPLFSPTHLHLFITPSHTTAADANRLGVEEVVPVRFI